ncbi:hypothetical protein KP509_14G071800 [Ceratopteris richardii]|uniref:Phytocyanin domain-containing protein n=1 Tax=Ceratopteris richardii TaxID=49495 RepID=A0A8T2TCY2_CERRI|nr:hypothetical protein KP509_14G071800 [Ceratopteris richardii]
MRLWRQMAVAAAVAAVLCQLTSALSTLSITESEIDGTEARGNTRITGRVWRVGGVDGWVVGIVNYTEWALKHTFYVGDYLEFRYLEEFHSVVEVADESAYETCIISDPLEAYSDGDSLVELRLAKTYYFICGVMRDCLLGQKLQVQVLPLHNLAQSPIESPNTPSPTISHALSLPPVSAADSSSSKYALNSSLRIVLLTVSIFIFACSQSVNRHIQ